MKTVLDTILSYAAVAVFFMGLVVLWTVLAVVFMAVSPAIAIAFALYRMEANIRARCSAERRCDDCDVYDGYRIRDDGVIDMFPSGRR